MNQGGKDQPSEQGGQEVTLEGKSLRIWGNGDNIMRLRHTRDYYQWDEELDRLSFQKDGSVR